MDSSNWGFKVKAKQRIKTLEGKPATLETINGLDAKTGATYTTQACKDAIRVELKKAAAAPKAEPVEEAKDSIWKGKSPIRRFLLWRAK